MTKDNNFRYNDIIQNFYKELPKFAEGRIDYSNSEEAPVLTCFIRYQNKILLLKRSDKVRAYQGLWNTVAGYLDDLKSLQEKAFEELNEELGISQNNISRIISGTPYKFHDPSINKTWIIFPLLAELKNKPKIRLDWEHTDFKWIEPEKIKDYKIVPKLDISLVQILNIE